MTNYVENIHLQAVKVVQIHNGLISTWNGQFVQFRIKECTGILKRYKIQMYWAKVHNLVKNMVDGTLCDLEKLVWTSKTIM